MDELQSKGIQTKLKKVREITAAFIDVQIFSQYISN